MTPIIFTPPPTDPKLIQTMAELSREIEKQTKKTKQEGPASGHDREQSIF